MIIKCNPYSAITMCNVTKSSTNVCMQLWMESDFNWKHFWIFEHTFNSIHFHIFSPKSRYLSGTVWSKFNKFPPKLHKSKWSAVPMDVDGWGWMGDVTRGWTPFIHRGLRPGSALQLRASTRLERFYYVFPLIFELQNCCKELQEEHGYGDGDDGSRSVTRRSVADLQRRLSSQCKHLFGHFSHFMTHNFLNHHSLLRWLQKIGWYCL